MKSLILLGSLFLSYQSLAANAENGKKIYKTCIQCHGADGMGMQSQQAPAIKGQHEWYIISSIKAFKEGKDRKNPKMLPFIAGLSDSDIEDVALYVSTME